MITLTSMLLFLAFGVIVGAVGRVNTPEHERGGWLFYLLSGVFGSFAFGFAGRGLGAYGPGEPAGLVLSLVGAMLFVAAYHDLRLRFGKQLPPPD